MIAHALLAVWLLATWACVGAVAWRAIHALTAGAWGVEVDMPLRWQRAWLPLVAMLGLPFLIAATHIFPWIAQAPAPSRQWYLNYPALAARTVACIVVWAAGRWLAGRAPALCLILWLFACGVFANDWIVSLQPEWRSSAIGLVAAVGQLCVAMAIAIVVVTGRAGGARAESVRHDLAGLLVALCLGWAYLVGIDYLTAWMADLPYETVWYLPRTRGAWAGVAVAALLLHLVIPCGLLLPRALRARPGILRWAAVSVLAGEACHLAWMTMP